MTRITCRLVTWWAVMVLITSGAGAHAGGPSEMNAGVVDTVPSPSLTDHDTDRVLGGYLQRAALNNAELEAAFNRWKAALEKAVQSDILPDPRFTFGYFIRSVETRVGPQRARYGIAQTFPWFGKLSLKGEMATQEAHAQKTRYDGLKLQIFNDVKNAFYEYAYLAKAIAITRDNIELMRYLESVARTRYSTGSTPYAAVLRTQVEVEKLEDRVRTLQDLRRPLVAKLNATMNAPLDSPLPWPPGIPTMQVSLSDEEILAQSREHNPQLKLYGHLVAKEEAAVRLAEKDYFPDFTFSLETIVTDEARNRMTPDSGKDAVIASVVVNLPIWFNRQNAAVREAQRKRLAAVEDRVGREQRVLSDLHVALYKYRDAWRKIELYRDTLIPKAEQSFNVTLEAFRAGGQSSLELIDAEKTLLEFDLAYARTLADHAQRLSEIEMLLGAEIPYTVLDGESRGPLPHMASPSQPGDQDIKTGGLQ